MTTEAAVRVATPSLVTRARNHWRGPVGYCLRVYLLVRFALLALAVLVSGMFPDAGDDGLAEWPAPRPGGWSTAFTAWENADALQYLRIAELGYRDDNNSGAFFPLYPLLSRLLGIATGGHPLLGAYLVANASLVVALVLLYKLTALELSESMARKAVLYLCVFPTGFFLFAPFSESLFLALAIGTLYAARRSRWGAAAGLGVLAALCRSPGALLALALVVEGLLQARGLPRRQRLRVIAASGAAAAVTGCGLLLYLGYWQLRAGDWRIPVDLQKSAWLKESAWPWETLWAGVQLGLQGPGAGAHGYFLADLAVVALVLAAGVWVAMRVRLTYVVYTWSAVLFPLFLMWPPRPLLSLPRIYLVVFPVVWALAHLAEKRRAHDAVLVATTMAMAVLAAAFATAHPFF